MVTDIISLFFLIILITTILSVIKGAPYIPSDQSTIKRMIKFAKVKKGEKAVDLGAGDGRVIVELAKAGAIAYGYENFEPEIPEISTIGKEDSRETYRLSNSAFS